MPKALGPHVSLLIPHLGGKAYALRSAIVSAVGQLIQHAYSEDGTEEADAQGKLLNGALLLTTRMHVAIAHQVVMPSMGLFFYAFSP